MEKGESPLDALYRELQEELGVDLRRRDAKLFSRFRFSVEPAGIAALDRFYYQMRIEPELVQSMRLGEGSGMQLVGGREAVNSLRLVPYDAFALWLHCFRDKVARAGP
jgi:8-oxo-dGTP pyrophosphatase MutT (NUDIX family)